MRTTPNNGGRKCRSLAEITLSNAEGLGMTPWGPRLKTHGEENASFDFAQDRLPELSAHNVSSQRPPVSEEHSS